MVSNLQFDRIRKLALELAGIELVERHQELLNHRFRRLGILDEAGLDTFLSEAESGDPAATRRLVHLLTTKFTGFFRHPAQFKLAAEHAMEVTRRGGVARLWSAGAATGEEPYSLAMALVEAFGRDDPPASVLATDVDAEALAVGERGEYAESALRDLERSRRERFFVQRPNERTLAMTPSLRRIVEFRTVNLVRADWAVEGPFDVIMVRNVLMYLESGHRDHVLRRMLGRLAPEGLLMIDPVEGLGSMGSQFLDRGDGVYLARLDACKMRSGMPIAGEEYSRN